MAEIFRRVMAAPSSAARRVADLFSGVLDRIREPGWPRTIIGLALAIGFLLIPYPIHVTGDFEVITLDPPEVRTLTDGVLAEVLVHAGDRVEKGQVVAKLLGTYLEIEKTKVQAELDEREAKLRLAQKGYRQEEIEKARLKEQELQAMVNHAKTMLDRNRELSRSGFIPKEELDRSETEYIQRKKELAQAEQELKQKMRGLRDEEIDQARAEVEQLVARLKELDQHLTWTEVRATVPGIVTTPEHALQARIGQHVARGEALMKIVEPPKLVARIMVPEAEFGDVTIGHAVTLRAFQFPSELFDGEIDKIEPTVEQPNEFLTTVPVLSKLQNQDGKLRIGTTGKAKINCGWKFVGYIIYRRALRSLFVQIWSWY